MWGEVMGAAVFVSLLLHYDISPGFSKRGFWQAFCSPAPSRTWRGTSFPTAFSGRSCAFIASLFFAPAPLGRLADGLLGGLGVALGLLAVVTVLEKRMGREAMGGGDLKLLFVTGLFFRLEG